MPKVDAKGFTLIELLVVISIVTFLSSIVLAGTSSAREKARLAAAMQFNASLYHTMGDTAAISYDFDECSGTTATDGSGNNNNGTIYSSASYSTSTYNGRGCSLNLAGSGYVLKNSPSNAPSGSSPRTMSIWFKLNSTSISDSEIFGVGNNGGAGRLAFWLSRSGCNGGPGIGVEGVNYWSAFPLTLDTKWHHLVASYKGGDITTTRLFFDGTEQKVPISGCSTAGTVLNTVNDQAAVGTIPGFGAYLFNGSVDEVRLYSTAL